MIAATHNLKAALQTGGINVLVRAEAWKNGLKIADLDVIDGSIELDRTASTRRCVHLTVSGLSWYAPDASYIGDGQFDINPLNHASVILGNILVPGIDVKIYWDYMLPSEISSVNLGTYRLSDRTIYDSADGVTISVTGYDKSRYVSRRPWRFPYEITKNTPVGQAIDWIWKNRLGQSAQTSIASTSYVTPRMVVGGDPNKNDPWLDITELAASMGCEAYVGADDALHVSPVPNPDMSAPDWSFSSGTDGVLIEAQESESDDDAVSGVVVEASSSNNPKKAKTIRVEVWNTDPTSPYNVSTIGYKPLMVRTKRVFSHDQAVSYANHILRTKSGVTSQIDVTSPPNPLIEPGDVVLVRSVWSGINEDPFGKWQYYLVDRVSFNLSPEQPTMITCSRRLS